MGGEDKGAKKEKKSRFGKSFRIIGGLSSGEKSASASSLKTSRELSDSPDASLLNTSAPAVPSSPELDGATKTARTKSVSNLAGVFNPPRKNSAVSGEAPGDIVQGVNPPLPRTKKKEDRIMKPVLDRVLSGLQIPESRKLSVISSLKTGLIKDPRLNKTAETLKLLEGDIQQALVVVKYTQLIVKAQSVARRWLGVRRLKRIKEEYGGDPQDLLTRLAAFREVIVAETKFSSGLQSLNLNIYQPLRAAAEKKLFGSAVSVADIDVIFRQVPTVVTTHQRIQEMLATVPWPELTGIGKCFLDIRKELGEYDAFARELKLSQATLTRLSDDPKFKAKLGEFGLASGIENIRDVLSSPLKHTQFLAKAVENICARTPADNAEYANLKTASDRIKIKNAAFQLVFQQNAPRAALADIGRRFEFEVVAKSTPGYSPEAVALQKMIGGGYDGGESCKLLHEGAVTEVETVKDKEKRDKAHVFLFSNGLVVARPGKLLKPKAIIDFDAEEELSVKKADETSDKGKPVGYNLIFVASHGDSQHVQPNKEHTFSFKEEVERDSWFAKIDGAIDYHKRSVVFAKLSLEELAAREKSKIPKILLLVDRWLRRNSDMLQTPNLFAENVSAAQKPEMRRWFTYVSKTEFTLDGESTLDNDATVEALFMTLNQFGPLLATAAVKMFLNGIPEPLLGFNRAVKLASISTSQDILATAKELRALLQEHSKDDPRLATLLFLGNLLEECSAVDRARLSTYVGPIIIREKVSTIEYSKHLQAINQVLSLLFRHGEYLNGDERLERERLQRDHREGADDSQSDRIHFVVAIHAFQETKGTHMSIKKGDVIRVVSSMQQNWLMGVNAGGRTGKFPSNYVEEVPVVVRARHAWTPGPGQGRMVLDKGAILQVLEQRASGWWRGRLIGSDEDGFFPANFCTFEHIQVKSPPPKKVVVEEDSSSSDSETTDANDSVNEEPKSEVKVAEPASQKPEPQKPVPQPQKSEPESAKVVDSKQAEQPAKSEGPPARALPTPPSKKVTDVAEASPANSKVKAGFKDADGKAVFMKAKFAFTARSDKEISFQKDDEIKVLKVGKGGIEKGGWWSGELLKSGACGKFPSNYCERVDR